MENEENPGARLGRFKRKASVAKPPPALESLPSSGDESDGLDFVQQGRKRVIQEGRTLIRREGQTGRARPAQPPQSASTGDNMSITQSELPQSPTPSEITASNKSKFSAKIETIIAQGLQDPSSPYGPRDIDFNDLEAVRAEAEVMEAVLGRMNEEPRLSGKSSTQQSKFYATAEDYFHCLDVLCKLPRWRQKQHNSVGEMAEGGQDDQEPASVVQLDLKEFRIFIFKCPDVKKVVAIRDKASSYLTKIGEQMDQETDDLRELLKLRKTERVQSTGELSPVTNAGGVEETSTRPEDESQHEPQDRLDELTLRASIFASQFLKSHFEGLLGITSRKLADFQAASEKAHKKAKKRASRASKKAAKKASKDATEEPQKAEMGDKEDL